MAGMSAIDRWEYLTLPEGEVDQDQLSALGQDGWELVMRGNRSDDSALYFKRRLPSFREVVTLDQRRAYNASVGRDEEETERTSR
jgi:hypothetical protein